MGMIKSEALEECYRQWVNAILGSARLEEKKGDNIGVDGKTIRGSGHPGLKPIHMISAWSSRAGLTLAQLKTAEKSNEITAIPDLLEVLDIAGSIVTIDAMGCQTDIAKAIIAGKGEYVLACKENQAGLYNEIEEYFIHADTLEKEEDKEEILYSKKVHREKNHGRLEKRTYELIEECSLLSRFHDFEGAKSIGRVSSQTTMRDGSIRSDKRYFITSLAKEQAIEQFAQAVRSHWGIENSCHWVLDVTFAEDACRTRDEIAAQNLSLARKLALALAKRVPDEVVERYSHNKAKYTSLKKRLFLAGLYPDFMVEILLASA
jgi:predicted transposase YbfD/YdcC